MKYTKSKSSTGKPYIIGQIKWQELDLFYVQVSHSKEVNKPYGLAFYIKNSNLAFKKWLKCKAPQSKTSLSAESKVAYAPCRIRPKSKGVHIQILGPPLNRPYGFAKTFEWQLSIQPPGGCALTTMRKGVAQKNEKPNPKKVFALVDFGNQVAVTCRKCQNKEEWCLGHLPFPKAEGDKYMTYIQTFMPCYTCGKVLKHDPPEKSALKKLREWMENTDSETSVQYDQGYDYVESCGMKCCKMFRAKCKELGLDPNEAWKGVWNVH